MLVGSKSVEFGSFGQAAGHYYSDGLSVVGRSVSNAVDRTAHTRSSLAVFLSNQVYTGKKAHRRSRHWWGRFYNKYSGEHAYYVKLKGLHLIQALRVVDRIPTGPEIPVGANCAIRPDFAEEILQELKKQLADQAR